MKSNSYRMHLAVATAVGVLTAPAAFANSVLFDFGPQGSPSMTALFQDSGPGQVQLVIDAVNLNGNNTLNSLCFNFNPNFDATSLIFNQTDSVGGVSGKVSAANDSYKVGGGSGKFDIDIVFGPDFVTGDSVTYSITGIPNLSVNDFLFVETPSAGRTAGYAAGSIQELSDVVIVQGQPRTVPEVSSTLGLLAIGLGAVGIGARRFKARNS